MAKIASKVIHVKGFPGPQFRFNPEDCCGQEHITASDQKHTLHQFLVTMSFNVTTAPASGVIYHYSGAAI